MRCADSTGALLQAEARHAGHVGCQVSHPAVPRMGRPHHAKCATVARRQQRLQARQRGRRKLQVEVQRRRIVQLECLRLGAETWHYGTRREACLSLELSQHQQRLQVRQRGGHVMRVTCGASKLKSLRKAAEALPCYTHETGRLLVEIP